MFGYTEFYHIGCFQDKENPRALTEFIHGNVASPRDCYKLAKEKGYPAFALQAGKECWSSENATITYCKHGEKTTCRNGMGGDWANDVYIIGSNKNVNLQSPIWDQNVDYQSVGCMSYLRFHHTL